MNGVLHLLKRLRNPSQYLRELSFCNLAKYVLAFLAIGGCAQLLYPFPHFYVFTSIFLFIGTLCLFAEQHFCREMEKIRTDLAGQPPANRANLFFNTRCVDTPIYLWAPLCTVLLFGTGGCLLYREIQPTPTLLWILMLFAIVVFISIVGYLQYAALAVYLALLSHCEDRYMQQEKKLLDCIPAESEWIKRLTRLTHTYRSIFFTLGSVYILAFSAFCFLPEFYTDRASPIFALLWGVIFVAIVFAFPIISLLEHHWIKAVVWQLKTSYVFDLEQEKNLLARRVGTAVADLVQTLCTWQILNSKDYPAHSVWATGYAAFLSVLNLISAVVTITTGLPTVIIALGQIP